MQLTRALRSSSSAGAAGLVVLVLVVAWPALKGELIPYLDNPVHLAEIHDLAVDGNVGWTDLGFCGFPLSLLQSPLNFTTLAFLTRRGIPLEPLYTLATLVGLAAPALAFYFLATKRVGATWSFALASTLVVYRGSLVGSASALGGMFGFHLASAALLLVLDGLSQRRRSLRSFATLALLSGFIGLTHMYVTIALVYFAVVHAAFCVFHGKRRVRVLFLDLAALGLGAAAAAAYWMPNLLAHTSSIPVSVDLARSFSHVVTTSAPVPLPGVHGFGRIISDPVFYLDAAPQFFVLLLVVVGLNRVREDDDEAPRYGLVSALLFLVLLFVQKFTHLLLLGPQPDRQVFFVRLGLLVSAISGVRQVTSRTLQRLSLRIAVATTLAFGLLSERVVAHEALPRPDDELVAAEQVWTFMRASRKEDWGRVYVQDTYGIKAGGSLERSHLMARTAEFTGVEQVGAYYHNTPYEHGWLYGDPFATWAFDPTDSKVTDRLADILKRSNATHLLLTDPRMFPAFQRDLRFETRFSVGRFLLLELLGASLRWARVADGSGDVFVDRPSSGDIQLKLDGSIRRISIRETYHPFWRVVGDGSVRITPDPDGFMEVDRNGSQSPAITLRYVPPKVPRWFSLGGMVVILVLLGEGWRRAFRSRALEYP